MNPLAPSGTLNVGVVEAPTAGVFFVAILGGEPAGVTVDLGAALAREHGLPFAFTVFPNSGECTEALHDAAVDVGFMPVDEHRRTRVLFGPGYYDLESTYLVTAASGIATLEEVDRPGIRVVGIEGTTTIRAAARSLANTTPSPARSVEDAVALLANGQADALALSRDSIAQLIATLPGSRATPGGFQQTTIAIAVPPNRPDALPLAAAFLDNAKRNGLVRRALDTLGLHSEQVAP